MAQDRGAKSKFATRAPDTATVHVSVVQVRIQHTLVVSFWGSEITHLAWPIHHLDASSGFSLEEIVGPLDLYLPALNKGR